MAEETARGWNNVEINIKEYLLCIFLSTGICVCVVVTLRCESRGNFVGTNWFFMFTVYYLCMRITILYLITAKRNVIDCKNEMYILLQKRNVIIFTINHISFSIFNLQPPISFNFTNIAPTILHNALV